ncbi:hydrolase [Phyllobacterium salinisoli]|uniref:Hydrolase n=1 Tax=Phyllobacterium salinisoli TaxID=1899321 RepID=A0A368K791_9HYPH|nr:carbon-nitrogen hydrolase family protein [Phyllobacterium salinisoli]RCS25074.1 hydrolase [Phyllobacterium salinisoli]
MMRIALFQMQVASGNVAANLGSIAEAAQKAADNGASLLVAPELALTGYGAGDAIRSLAEPADGAQIAKLEAIAAAHGVAIVSGFAERDGAVVYNSTAYVDGRGGRAIYRKSHLFGDYERGLFQPAPPATCLFRHGGLKIGILICYDVEFPENVRRLALAGADMVVVPTALPAGPSGTFIAQKMIQVRAFENQIFLAYVNHAGADETFTFAGMSRLAAPDGGLLVEIDDAEEALRFADIDPAARAAVMREYSYLGDLGSFNPAATGQRRRSPA